MTGGSVTRKGFTLLELVVAVAIGGYVFSLAALLMTVCTEQAVTVAQVARTRAAEGTSEMHLRWLVGQMHSSDDSSAAPVGTSSFIRFSSWCEDPAGWRERCEVEISLPPAGESLRGLQMRTSHGGNDRILTGARVLGFLFLEVPHRGGIWRREWIDPSTLPPAVGIVRDADTLILRTRSGD